MPSAAVVSNDDAQAYDDTAGWRTRLPRHVSVPVRWRSTMETLVALGATEFVEVGHGSMLAAPPNGAPGVMVRNVAGPDDLAAAHSPHIPHEPRKQGNRRSASPWRHC